MLLDRPGSLPRFTQSASRSTFCSLEIRQYLIHEQGLYPASEMNELESLLREALPEVTIATMLDGKIARWPEDAEHLFGFSQDEATGRFLHKLLVPSGQGNHEQTLLQQTLVNGHGDRNSVWRHKKGYMLKVEVNNRLASDMDILQSATDGSSSSPPSPSADLLIIKSIRVDDPRARLLAVFDILDRWIQVSNRQDLPGMQSDASRRQLLADAAVTGPMAGTDTVIHELALAAGLDNPSEFVHIWQILMNGSIIAGHQGNPVSAAEVRRAANVVLEEWGIQSRIQ